MVWHGMAWHGMVRDGMVWDGMVWYGMAWYGMAWHGMVWHGMVWHGMVWHGMAWYGMVWYGMLWYGKVWYGMVLPMMFAFRYTLGSVLLSDYVAAAVAAFLPGLRRTLTRLGPSTCVVTTELPKTSPWRSVHKQYSYCFTVVCVQ